MRRASAFGRSRFYGCLAANAYNGINAMVLIPRHVLEDLILDALKQRLMAPDLAKEFITEFHAEINRLGY